MANLASLGLTDSIISATFLLVPIVTVLLHETTVNPFLRYLPIFSATAKLLKDQLHLTSGGGVPTAINTTSDLLTACSYSVVK